MMSSTNPGSKVSIAIGNTIAELAKVVDSRLGPRAEGATDEIEAARREAFTALCEARGDIVF